MTPTTLTRKHWSANTFAVVVRDSETGNEYGYCSQCKADMQRFASDAILRHYKSHGYAKRLGLAWTR